MMLHPSFCLVNDQVGYLLGRGTKHSPQTRILLSAINIHVGEHTRTTMWQAGCVVVEQSSECRPGMSLLRLWLIVAIIGHRHWYVESKVRSSSRSIASTGRPAQWRLCKVIPVFRSVVESILKQVHRLQAVAASCDAVESQTEDKSQKCWSLVQLLSSFGSVN